MLNEMCYETVQQLDKSGRISVLPIKKLIKVTRNQKCFCNSGLKYKKCCYNILESFPPPRPQEPEFVDDSEDNKDLDIAS